MSQSRAVYVAVLLSSGLLACSDVAEPPPMGATGASGSTAGTAAAASGAGVGASPAAGAAGTAVATAGTAGPASAGRGTPPVAGSGSTTAGAPAGGAAAPAAGAAAGPTAGASGMTGAAGMSAGQGAVAGTSGEPSAPQTCAAGLTGKAGRMTVRLEHAGVMRNYILNVPSSYKGDKPVPLVLYFHPLLFDASFAESGSGYNALSSKEGFIVAYPDGQESAAWNVGPCCTASRDVDDVGFAKAIVAQVQSNYCVDAKRVYASGFSMGGGMSHYLGCEAADVFAAVAPGAFDLLAENTCAPARPITVISFRSESDAVVPYAGGVKQSAPNGFVGKHTFLGAEGTFDKWAEVDGCTGEPVMESGGCKTHKQCKAGVEVTLCTVPGGHTWPNAERSWQTLSRFSLP